MTIGDYIAKLQAVNPHDLAVAAMDENGEAITAMVKGAWFLGQSPDGDELSDATWDGSEVSPEYRDKWKVGRRIYRYRTIDISGDTRRGLQVRRGRIFSIAEYWDRILRSFRAAGFSPVSFSRVPASSPAKRKAEESFFRLLRAKLANK